MNVSCVGVPKEPKKALDLLLLGLHEVMSCQMCKLGI